MKRLLILRLLILLVVAGLIGRLYQLQLVDNDAKRYGSDNISKITKRYVLVPPRRGEILARDGESLLAESVPVFSVALLPGSLPPLDTPERRNVLGRVAQLSEITSTLTYSSSRTLARQQTLSADLDSLGLDSPVSGTSHSWDVAAEDMLAALRMSETYSDVLTLHNPVHDLVDHGTIRNYETVIVKENVSPEMTLLVRENSFYLPGVVVVEDYQRRYPQSDDIPSLSHTLGYIGRINTCELVEQNASSSWLDGLNDVISHMPECGLVEKQPIPDVIGIPDYRNNDRIGKDGLEASYEDQLRGTMGIQMLGVDALERPVSASTTLQPVVSGNNLVTTIDLEFQRQVEQILKRWIDESERRRQTAEEEHKREYHPITNGVAVVLDVRTGEVLALSSLPAYDNNVWVDNERLDDLQQLLSPADPEQRAEMQRLAPLTHRAVAGQYPPGSSLKPFVGAAALQAQVIQPDTELRDPGRIILKERGGQIFVLPNSTPRDNGEITISDAMMVSSNVFFASIGGGNDQATNLGEDTTIINGLNINGLAEGLRWFGLGDQTGVQLPAEAPGRVPTPNWKAHALREPWTTGDTYNTSIGQGYLEATPLQMAVATAAVANNGLVFQPRLVRAVTGPDGNIIEETQPEVLREVPVDDGYLDVIHEGMRRSITEGINVAARNECSGLSIAGKTGTAEFGPIIELPDDKITRQSHSWFVGFAPYENPEIAVVVLLEGTGDLDDGSSTLAVPAVTQIMQAYFGVTPPVDDPENPDDDLPPFCPVLPGTPLWQPPETEEPAPPTEQVQVPVPQVGG